MLSKRARNQNGVRYFAFIDESGKKEYLHPYDARHIHHPDPKNKEFWRDNYLAVVSLLIPEEHVPDIARTVIETKKWYFNTTSVEVKSSWLRFPYQRKKRYCQPFSIGEDEVKAFGGEMLSLFSRFQNEITIVACVFDKRYYRNRDKNDPFLCSMQVVFERIEYVMQEKNANCTLIIDQLEDSLAINTGRNGELFEVFVGIRRSGRQFVRNYYHIDKIEFRKSKDDHLLQLADLAAYNVFRQFVDFGLQWEIGISLSLYEGFKTILKNFRTKNGELRG
jgi:hypothetical protein